MSDNGSNAVSQYSRNLETGTLTALSPATVAAGTSPYGIAVSPDGLSAYVANKEAIRSQYSATARCKTRCVGCPLAVLGLSG